MTSKTWLPVGATWHATYASFHLLEMRAGRATTASRIQSIAQVRRRTKLAHPERKIKRKGAETQNQTKRMLNALYWSTRSLRRPPPGSRILLANLPPEA